nr:hypothetical protein [Tanacetum cinerariifolium]
MSLEVMHIHDYKQVDNMINSVSYSSTMGVVDVYIGANPYVEGCGEDEGVDDQAVKVVDIVDTFRL